MISAAQSPDPELVGRDGWAPGQLFRHHTNCRCCGTPLKRIADLGAPNLTSVFPRIGDPLPPKIPMRLAQCPQCKLLQLEDTTRPQLMYREGYGYKSGINESMVRHLKEVAAYCGKWIEREAKILDIGCNDGTLLKAFRAELGPEANLNGMDPVALDVEGAGIVRDYFRPLGVKYDLITAVACFYDMDDPNAFMRDIYDSLKQEGLFFVEMQYAGAMQRGMWDQICHEHVCYYGLDHICQLAWRNRMHIVDFGFNDTNGGSLWCMIGKIQPGPAVDGIREAERKWDWTDFEREINMGAKNIRNSIGKRTVDVMGASTKGNVMLQMANLGPESIRRAVDRNPDKAGRMTANGIPIVDDRDMTAEDDPHAYLVLPYHFREGILARYAAARERGVKFIFPLPSIDEV